MWWERWKMCALLTFLVGEGEKGEEIWGGGEELTKRERFKSLFQIHNHGHDSQVCCIAQGQAYYSPSWARFVQPS